MAPPARVTMLLFSPFEFDSRVLREIRSLVGAGFRVRLIASRRAGLPHREKVEGADVERVPGSVRELGPLRLLAGVLPRRGGGREGAPTAVQPAERRAGAPAVLRRLLLRVGAIVSWRMFAVNARRAAAREPADIWYAHDLDTLPIAARLRRRLGGRLVYDSHELFVDVVLDPPRLDLERRWWHRREAALISTADRVFVDIPARGRILADRYEITPPQVIMNVPPYAPAPPPAGRLRSRLPREPGAIVLYAGALTMGRQRGLACLVRALPSLPADADLVLMGPAESRVAASLATLAAGLGVGERLHVLEPVHPDEIRDQIADADLGVVPFLNLGLNNYRSLPTKLFDYLGAGLPVAASDFPDIRELIERHEVGASFDPEDPASIAGAISRLLEDQDRLRRLRENAARAASLYRWENEERKLLEAIESLRPAAPVRPLTTT